MRTITFRDEKLFKIAAHDYGDIFHRALGLLLHSIAKGIAIAILVGIILLAPGLSFRDWFTLFVPVALVSAVWMAVTDRRSYVGEIEIYPDQIIWHSGEKTLGIGRNTVRSIQERSTWTVFGWVHGLLVRSKGASIFIPAATLEYPEIKSKLGAWRSIVS